VTRGRTPALKYASEAGAERLADEPLNDFTPLYRAQFEAHRPWWWSRRPQPGTGGRVDLAAPDGTICFATSATGALIEKIWDADASDPADPAPQVVLRTTLDRIILWATDRDEAVPDRRVADLTHPQRGLPKEFSTASHEVTQGWADAARAYATGNGGIVYWLRLDPADGRCVALFETGPDDDEPGFVLEPFRLAELGRASLLATELPTQLFSVVDLPSDEDVVTANLDAV
jgi:hypothetical protein